MSADFKFTGPPKAALTASISGAGVIINSPGIAKFITIFDVLASQSTLLRENNAAGAILAYIPSGSCNLSASITGGVTPVGRTGNAIYNSAGNVTVNYSIMSADWI